MPVNPVAAAPAAGPMAPGANPAAGAAGPLGGFEALMAALFGAEGQGASTLAKAINVKPGDGATPEGEASGTKDGDTAADPTTAVDPTAAAQTLLASLVAPPTQAPVADAAASTATGADADAGSAPAAATAPVTPPTGEKAAIFQPDFPGQGRGLEVARQAVAGQPPRGEPAFGETAPAVSDGDGEATVTPPGPQSASRPVGPPAHAQASVVAYTTPARPAPNSTPATTTTQPAELGDGTEATAPSEPGVSMAAAPAEHAAKAQKSAQAAAKGAAELLEPAPAQTAAEAAPEPQPTHAAADSTTGSAAAAPHAAATHAAALRGAPETVATLAAQILKKLDSRTTRFEMELDPAGLGRVDVRLEINAQGRLTAAMAFDNPQSAQELRSRSNELARALEQAGFDVSDGLFFDVADQSGNSGQNGGGQDRANEAPFRGRAFQAALATAAGADLAPTVGLTLARARASGVDIRI
jgi:flagellar hook-length control protein FliK